MPAVLKLPKTHRVTKRLSGGRVAIYWYRCRGGDLLMRFDGANLREAERAEAAGATALAAAYAKRPSVPMTTRTLGDVITAYKAAPDGLQKLAGSTRKEWARYLDQIVQEFGDLPTKALKAKGIRAKFIEWRNSRSGTTRTADYGIQVLSRLLSWAVENELVECNPAEGIKGIYKSSRADQVVEKRELEAILAKVSREAGRAIRLAAATGMRRGDLIDLR